MDSVDYLKYEDIFNRARVEEKDIYIKEWGGNIRIRGLTKRVQQELKKNAMVNGVMDTNKMEILLLQNCLVEPVLTEDQLLELIKKSDFNVIDGILNQILNIVGLLPEVREKAIRDFYAGFPSTNPESRGGGENFSLSVSEGVKDDGGGVIK